MLSRDASGRLAAPPQASRESKDAVGTVHPPTQHNPMGMHILPSKSFCLPSTVPRKDARAL